MQFEDHFKRIGLSDREITVYLTLLQTGPTSGYHLSKQTGLVTSTIYFLLDELEQKNMVSKIEGETKPRFIATDPRKIVEEHEHHVQELKATIPSLLAQAGGTSTTTVGLYEGTAEKKLVWDKFVEASDHSELLSFLTFFPEGLIKEHKKHVMGILDSIASTFKQVRAIAPDITDTDVQPGSIEALQAYVANNKWNIRSLPLKKYSPIMTIHISGNVVRMSSRNPDHALLIEDKNIADTHRQLFELAWENAGKKSEVKPR